MNADKHVLKDRNEAPKRDRELSKPIEMPINKPPPPPLIRVHLRSSVVLFFICAGFLPGFIALRWAVVFA
jgi:hypothetical protein